eukprot:m51a1_g2371 putative serine threonine-protein kinase 10 (1901) ;mRNA; r:655050-664826
MAQAACLDPYIRKNEDPTEILRLDELIAEGSFGIVYKGVHLGTNQTMAVKIIQLEEDETFEDLVIEIEVLTRCRNENIIGYFGSWRKADELFIGMELADGGSAADIYQELNRPMEEKEIQLICRDTLRGLQYLHSNGILHRDIKGANILIKQDGSVKLVDFGVCGKVSAQSPTRRTFIGTPYWMAPEVIENKGAPSPYDGRCDVWSLGITLLELAHGEPPLSELHPMKALFQIPYRTPPTLNKPQLWSSGFNDFVTQSLMRDPRQRPTVGQLLNHPWMANCSPPSVLAAVVQMYLVAKKQNEDAEEADAMEEVTEEERKASEMLQQVEKTKPKAQQQPSSSIQAVEARIPDPLPSISSAHSSAAPSPVPSPAPTSPAQTAEDPSSGGSPVQHYSSASRTDMLPPSSLPGMSLPRTSSNAEEAGGRRSGPPPPLPPPHPTSPLPPAQPSPSLPRPQQIGTARSRPKTVHRTTARRTAEIKKNINRKLMRQQLQEIKAQQKVQQRELDALQAKHNEQKGRINRYYNQKSAVETAKSSREEEQNTKRVAAEREAELKRHKAELEQIQRQQVTIMKQWQKDCAAKIKADQKAQLDLLSERIRELKEHEKTTDKTNKTMDKRLREQVKLEQKISRQQEEMKATTLLQDQFDLRRLVEENEQILKQKREALELAGTQQIARHCGETVELDATQKRRVDHLKEQGAIQLEWKTKLSDYEAEALKQMHSLLREQFAQRQQTEYAQHKRQQALDMRDYNKELREIQKKQVQEFQSKQSRELKDASGDKKQLKQDQKADKDEFMRGITRKEMEQQSAKKKTMEQEEAELREHMDHMSQRLIETQDAELTGLQERNAAALQQMRDEQQRDMEQAEAIYCKTRLALLAVHQEEQMHLTVKMQDILAGVLDENLKKELALLREKQASFLSLVSKHHSQKLECLRSLHTVAQANRLKELRKEGLPEGEINVLVKMQEKEFEITKTGFKAEQNSLEEENAKKLQDTLIEHKQKGKAALEAASKFIADLRHTQEGLTARMREEFKTLKHCAADAESDGESSSWWERSDDILLPPVGSPSPSPSPPPAAAAASTSAARSPREAELDAELTETRRQLSRERDARQKLEAVLASSAVRQGSGGGDVGAKGAAAAAVAPEADRRTVELLSARVEGLQRVVALQEEQMRRAGGVGEAEASAIGRWRREVFALVVQREAQAIATKRDLAERDAQIAQLARCAARGELANALDAGRILESKLEAVQPVLEMERRSREAAERELLSAKECAAAASEALEATRNKMALTTSDSTYLYGSEIDCPPPPRDRKRCGCGCVPGAGLAAAAAPAPWSAGEGQAAFGVYVRLPSGVLARARKTCVEPCGVTMLSAMDKKPASFSIEVNNPTRTYYLGQPIEGRVHLCLVASKKAKAIVIELIAEVRVNLGARSNEVTRSLSSHRVQLASVGTQSPLWAEDGSSRKLAAGDHAFPFSIATSGMPTWLPASFDGSFGSVRYFLRATVQRQVFSDHKCWLAVAVVPVVDADSPQWAGAIRQQAQKKIGWKIMNGGTISSAVSAPRGSYYPGDTVPLLVEIINNSKKKRIERAQVSVLQRSVFKWRGSSRLEEKTLISSQVLQQHLYAGQTVSLNVPVQLPVVPPSIGSEYIGVSYHFALDVFTRKRRVMRNEASFVIGTIRYARPSPATAPVYQSAPSSSSAPAPAPPVAVAQAPPLAYPELPPTYDEVLEEDAASSTQRRGSWSGNAVPRELSSSPSVADPRVSSLSVSYHVPRASASETALARPGSASSASAATPGSPYATGSAGAAPLQSEPVSCCSAEHYAEPAPSPPHAEPAPAGGAEYQPQLYPRLDEQPAVAAVAVAVPAPAPAAYATAPAPAQAYVSVPLPEPDYTPSAPPAPTYQQQQQQQYAV